MLDCDTAWGVPLIHTRLQQLGRLPFLVIILLAATGWAAGGESSTDSLAAQPRYNVSKDYSPSTNPSLYWSYGYRLGSDAFALYEESANVNGLEVWRRPGTSDPNVLRNGTKSLISEAGRNWGPGQVSLHPGPSGEISIIRFKTPAAGDYKIDAAFSVGQLPSGGPATTTAVSVTAGKKTLLEDTIDGNVDVKDVAKLARTVKLGKGAQVDFNVDGNGSWTYDTTFVRITIAPVQPANVDVSLRAFPDDTGYTLESKLTSSRANCVRGVNISFQEDGRLLGKVKTDSTGIARIHAAGRDKETKYAALAAAHPGCKGTVKAEVTTAPRPTGDRDGDGIADYIELEPKYVKAGGRVTRKDVWVECDYMKGMKPDFKSFLPVVVAFKTAPFKGPGGPGVFLHLTLADEIPFESQWGDVDTDAGRMATWKALRAARARHFTQAKYESHERFAHYCAFVNAINKGNITGISMDSEDANGGIPGDMFIVALGRSPLGRGVPAAQAGNLMHELGHNLGLHHGGDDDANFEPNYFSVMNYNYLLGFWQTKKGKLTQVPALDYSRFEAEPLNEQSLDEQGPALQGKTVADRSAIGRLAAKGYLAISDCPRIGSTRTTTAFNLLRPADWDCDGRKDLDPVAVDVNGQDGLTELKGQNDWLHIIWDGGAIGLGAEAPSTRPEPEPDFEEYAGLRPAVSD